MSDKEVCGKKFKAREYGTDKMYVECLCERKPNHRGDCATSEHFAHPDYAREYDDRDARADAYDAERAELYKQVTRIANALEEQNRQNKNRQVF